MKQETTGGVMIVSSDLTDSVITIERQAGGWVVVSLASRDNVGKMHVESHSIPLESIAVLPEKPRASYRSPTDEERRAFGLSVDSSHVWRSFSE